MFGGLQALPEEFRKTSEKGGIFTAVGLFICLIVMIMECKSYFDAELVTSVTVDRESNNTMIIRYDIMMHELPCKFLQVTINDAFGAANMGVANLWIKYTDVDDAGGEVKDAVMDQAPAPKLTPQEEEEMDADWSSSSDGFKHRSFDKMIKFHDFHFVNFFAGWCSHCKHFAPTWKSFGEQVDMKPIFKDARARPAFVKLIKVNCVDFQQTCMDERVRAYPAVRFYTKDKKYREYEGNRSPEDMRTFLETEIRKAVSSEEGRTIAHSNLKGMRSSGCRVKGDFAVPRVPGEFHLMATGKGSSTLDPHLTNVSHTVHKLQFVGYDEKSGMKARIFTIRQQMRKRFPNQRQKLWDAMSPLDGGLFPMSRPGYSPQHYLRVVANRWIDGELFYTFSSADRQTEAKAHDFDWYFDLDAEDATIPQAKFFYDIEPVTVVYSVLAKTLFDVLGSILSLLGAVFVFVRAANAVADVSVEQTKKYLLRERKTRGGGHLD